MTAHFLPTWRGLRHADSPRIDPELEAALDSGRPILATGRCSLEYSAYRLAVADFLDGVDLLQPHLGIDLRDAFVQSDLEEQLAATPTNRYPGMVGRNFSARFLVFERPELQLVGFIGMASASRLTTQLRQVWADELGAALEWYSPALAISDQSERLVRGGFELAPVRQRIEAHGVWTLSADRGLLAPRGDAASLDAFLSARRGGDYSKTKPDNARSGQRRLTDKLMVDGQVECHASVNAPPGFAYVTMREARSNGVVPKLLFLDTPDCHPPREEVGVGMPQVFDDGGRPICQVSNVRWMLKNLGALDASEFNAQLALRRYSTQRLRDRNSPGATWSDPGRRVYSTWQAVVNSLELYETGVLTIDLGRGSPVVIEGCWPTDGEPWAGPEDFARIRQWLADKPQRRKRAFANAPIVICGEAGSLKYAYSEDDDGEGTAYLLRPKGKASVGNVTAQFVASTVLDAVHDLGCGVRPATGSGDTRVAGYESEAAQLAAQLEIVRDEIDRIYTSLESVDDEGKLELSAEQIEGRLDEAAKLEVTANELQAAAGQLKDRRRRRLSRLREHTAAPDDALRMAAELASPTSPSIREWVRRGAITLEARSDAGRYELIARVRIDTDRGVLTGTGRRPIPTQAELAVAEGRDPNKDRRGHIPKSDDDWEAIVDDCIAAMAAGVPFWRQTRPCQPRLQARLIEKIAPRRRGLPLLNVTDPRLTQLITHAVVLSPDIDDEDLAERFGEPAELVARIREVHDLGRGRQGRWSAAGRSPTLVAMHVLAAQDEGLASIAKAARRAGVSDHTARQQFHRNRPGWTDLGYPEYRTDPCPGCEGFRLAPSLLPEVDTWVCLDCRTDRRGIVWQADPYDGFLALPDLWIDEGLLGDVPDVHVFPDRSLHRKLPELSEETVAALMADWRAGRPVSGKQGILTAYGLTKPMFDRLIASVEVRAGSETGPLNTDDATAPAGQP